MTALARLAKTRGALERPRILVASVSALTQRVPPRAYMEPARFSAAPGNTLKMEDVVVWLEANGIQRASTVRDVGDYASRGGILDLYPPGAAAPIRLDFFGDTLEIDPRLRSRDAALDGPIALARSRADERGPPHHRDPSSVSARPMSPSSARPRASDDLYAAVSEGRRAIGLEHWLPLLYDHLDTLFDYVGDAPLRARRPGGRSGRAAYRADRGRLCGAPRGLCEDAGQVRLQAAAARHGSISPREIGAGASTSRRWRGSRLSRPSPAPRNIIDCGGHVGRNFAPERQDENANVFDAAVAHIKALRGRGMSVIVAGWSDGSRERLSHVLAEHGLKSLELVSSLRIRPDRARRRVAAGRDRARTGLRGRRTSPSSASRTFSATGSCVSAKRKRRGAGCAGGSRAR